MTVRNIIFILGVLGAGFEAIRASLEAGATLSWHQLLMVGGAAAVAYALKWPSDVTASEAQEREDRARRESVLPPADPNELIDIPGPHVAPRRKRP